MKIVSFPATVRSKISTAVALALMCAVPAPVLAQGSAEDSAEEDAQAATSAPSSGTLNAVSVTADSMAEGYTPASTTVGGPLGLSLRETAQSVSVLTEELMQDLGATSTKDALRWAPGINLGYQEEQESNYFYARGYRVDNIMVDGVLGSSSAVPADLSLYEGVEVLRGPAGLYAGNGTNGSPGGAVNLVRKRGTNERKISLQTSAGSWDNYKATFDIGGPIGEKLRARAIVSHIDRSFFYDRSWRRNTTVGGTLDWLLTPESTITLGLDYEHRNASPAYYGMPRNFDGSMPDNYTYKLTTHLMGFEKADNYGFTAEWEHRFSNRWKLKTSYSHKKNRTHRDAVTFTTTNWDEQGRDVQFLNSRWALSGSLNRAFAASATGGFTLFGRDHEMVVGVDIKKSQSRTYQPVRYGYRTRFNRDNGELFIVEDFPFTNPDDIPWLPTTVDPDRIRTTHPTTQSGGYVNFRFTLADPLILTTGMRVSHYRYEGYSEHWNNYDHRNNYQRTGMRTPFAALNYDINDENTIYASYAEIFQPTSRYGDDGERIKPMEGRNYEAGWKSEWNDGQVNSMFSVYQLDRENEAWRFISSPCPILLEIGIEDHCYRADDKRRTRGFDFEVVGSVTPHWNLSLSLNWMKHERLRAHDRSGNISTEQGRAWNTDQPTKTFKLWSVHSLTGAAAGWRIGFGAQTQNRTYTSWTSREYKHNGEIMAVRPAGAVIQGGYTLFNLMASWRINPTWQLQWNVENVTNKKYLAQLSRTQVFFGEPRRYQMTLTGQF